MRPIIRPIRRAKVEDADTAHAVLLTGRDDIPLATNFADDVHKKWVRDQCRQRNVWLMELDGIGRTPPARLYRAAFEVRGDSPTSSVVIFPLGVSSTYPFHGVYSVRVCFNKSVLLKELDRAWGRFAANAVVP
jgi:hypothetical protein